MFLRSCVLTFMVLYECIMQVSVDIDYHQKMLASHLKVNLKEVIVGWSSQFHTLKLRLFH